MTMQSVLTFLDTLIAFYEDENQQLSSKEPAKVLNNTKEKEELRQKFDTIILKLTTSPLHALTIWPPDMRAMAWEKLQTFQQLSLVNEEKLKALLNKNKAIFKVVCKIIQESEKISSTYSPKTVNVRKKVHGPKIAAPFMQQQI